MFTFDYYNDIIKNLDFQYVSKFNCLSKEESIIVRIHSYEQKKDILDKLDRMGIQSAFGGSIKSYNGYRNSSYNSIQVTQEGIIFLDNLSQNGYYKRNYTIIVDFKDVGEYL